MSKSVEIGGLRIDDQLYGLVCDEIAPGTGIESEFWLSLSQSFTISVPPIAPCSTGATRCSAVSIPGV
jgi:hypothetical protein